jgi:hypothetical protein
LITHKREQRLKFYKEPSLIMANRNLLAPKPPGATLIKISYITTKQLLEILRKDTEFIITKALSSAQIYQLRQTIKKQSIPKRPAGLPQKGIYAI